MAKTQSRRRAVAPTEAAPTEAAPTDVEELEAEEAEDETQYATRSQSKMIFTLSAFGATGTDNQGNGYQIPKKTLTFEDASKIIKDYLKGREVDIEEVVPGGTWIDVDEASQPTKAYVAKDYAPILEAAMKEGQDAFDDLPKSKSGYLTGKVIVNLGDARIGLGRLLKERSLGTVQFSEDEETKERKEEYLPNFVVPVDGTLEQKIAYGCAFVKSLRGEEIDSEITALPDCD